MYFMGRGAGCEGQTLHITLRMMKGKRADSQLARIKFASPQDEFAAYALRISDYGLTSEDERAIELAIEAMCELEESSA